MKRLFLLQLFLLVGVMTVTSQENLEALKKALPQIAKREYKGTFINDRLVSEFLYEYQLEAENRGLNIKSYIDQINWIIIEPELSGTPLQLKGMNLGKIDKDHKMILLSRSCLLDRYILKLVLYRELSHYLGIPYEKEGLEIMSIIKPKNYSYTWYDDYEIRQFVYDDLFAELKKILN